MAPLLAQRAGGGGVEQPCLLLEPQQFHVEGEHSVGRDYARVTHGSIGIVWRADQLGSLADTHLSDTLVPAANNFPFADAKLEWLAPIP